MIVPVVIGGLIGLAFVLILWTTIGAVRSAYDDLPHETPEPETPRVIPRRNVYDQDRTAVQSTPRPLPKEHP